MWYFSTTSQFPIYHTIYVPNNVFFGVQKYKFHILYTLVIKLLITYDANSLSNQPKIYFEHT